MPKASKREPNAAPPTSRSAANISQACERGLVETIAEVRAARWLEENREALDSFNAWVEANGLPLAGKRCFDKLSTSGLVGPKR